MRRKSSPSHTKSALRFHRASGVAAGYPYDRARLRLSVEGLELAVEIRQLPVELVQHAVDRVHLLGGDGKNLLRRAANLVVRHAFQDQVDAVIAIARMGERILD